ncbi:hypothetical protein EX895_001867 [Sporisorium graminicola]|uniref:Uncharacterized protein n=1 Tax=Sporisorium graminicola TaxID=280036 RepID=A0A4U7KYC1_9BASI|nr:hypothetical protein EX895_001867 [Sporisorium graminicola]TKY89336.1 hypothetical protein EX895_001867 [Sporisorium graminicola]
MATNIASTSASSSSSAAVGSAAADKLRTGLEHKAQGNAAFTKGDIKAALASYHYAVLYLSGLESRSILGLLGENSGREGKPEDLSSDEEDQDDGEQQQQQQPVSVQSEKELSTVYSNMAACHLKQGNYDRAIQTADKSLKCDSGNVKAKYRRAQALRLQGELYEAQKFCRETIEALKRKRGKVEEEAVGSFGKELAAVERMIAVKEDKARTKWKGFLGRKPDVLAASGMNAEEKGNNQQDDLTKQGGASES